MKLLIRIWTKGVLWKMEGAEEWLKCSGAMVGAI